MLRASCLRRAAVGAVALLVAALVYPFVVRPWHRRWGVTVHEVERGMPGDDRDARTIEVTTRAITVNARPEHIWPWLVQMGNGRGGLYSYDWIDLLIGALKQASADRILPEYQNLRVGDVLPYAVGGP